MSRLWTLPGDVVRPVTTDAAPEAATRTRRRASGPAAPAPVPAPDTSAADVDLDVAALPDAPPTRAFLSLNTPDNQPVGIAFVHGIYVVVLIRSARRADLERVNAYPRGGLDLDALPRRLNLRDPGTATPDDKWDWSGFLQKNPAGTMMWGRVTRLPSTRWVPQSGDVDRGGWRLVGMAPPAVASPHDGA